MLVSDDSPIEKIPFSTARLMSEYQFGNNSEYTLETFREILASGNKSLEIYGQGVLVLQFGNIDIELNVLDTDDIGYYICANTVDGWIGIDYVNIPFELQHLSNIEEVMYGILMDYANKHDLHWDSIE